MGGSEQMDTSEAALGTRMQKKNWLRNFGELLDEKLFSRAPLRDSEPSRAANAISGVFLVNRVIKHDPEEPTIKGTLATRETPYPPKIWLFGVLYSLLVSTLFSGTVFYHPIYKKDTGNRVCSPRGFRIPKGSSRK